MKKWLLGLSTIIVTTTTSVAVVSCGNNQEVPVQTVKTEPKSEIKKIIVLSNEETNKLASNPKYHFLKAVDRRTIAYQAVLNSEAGILMKSTMERSSLVDEITAVYKVVYGYSKEFYIFEGLKDNKEIIFTESYGVTDAIERYINGKLIGNIKEYYAYKKDLANGSSDEDKKEWVKQWEQYSILINAMMANADFFNGYSQF